MRRLLLILVPLLALAVSCGGGTTGGSSPDGSSANAVSGKPFKIVGPAVDVRPAALEIDVAPAEGIPATGLEGCQPGDDGAFTIAIAEEMDFGPEDAAAIDADAVEITGVVNNCEPLAQIIGLADVTEVAPSPTPYELKVREGRNPFDQP